ncbi:MAG: hypothetical protein U0987_15650, partial [Afipia sp.]|nr:hypothetical protein [Afipia sp.]
KTNDPAAFFVLVMCSPLLQIAFAADIGSTSDGLLFRSFRRLAVFAQSSRRQIRGEAPRP